ncbi:MAG TPA: hypothetical protein DDZ89_21595 [Clostridiales bacterium]|jgi:hypothetical protein|nr:hypothetical protein [Clostridiales bacterium]
MQEEFNMTNTEKVKKELMCYIDGGAFDGVIRKKLTYPNVIMSSVYENGTTKEKIICPNCFNEWEFTYEGESFYGKRPACPNCAYISNGQIINRGSMESSLYYEDSHFYGSRMYFIDSGMMNNEQGLIFVEIDNASFSLDKPRHKIYNRYDISGFGFISKTIKKYFFYGAYSTRKISNERSYSVKKHITEAGLQYLTSAVGSITYSSNFEDRICRLENDANQTNSTPQNSVSAKQARKLMEANPVPEFIELNPTSKNFFVSQLIKKDNVSGKTTYQIYCSACKKSFQKQSVHYLSMTTDGCPRCGAKSNSIYSAGKCFHTRSLIIDKVNSDMLAVRVIEYRNKISEDFKVSAEAEETKRIYVNISPDSEKRISVINKEGEVWKYKKSAAIDILSFRFPSITISPNTAEVLKYSGFSEYLQCKDHRGLEISLSEIVRYISVWPDRKCIEKFVKVGWLSMTEMFLDFSGRDKYNLNADSLYGVLGMPKHLVKYLTQIKEGNPDIADVEKTKNYYEADPNVSCEDIEWCDKESVHNRDVCNIVKLLKISIRQVCEYLERVRISQCILPKFAVVSWYDYLDAAVKIGVDLTDKTARYPSSLKREHDRVTFKLELINNRKKEENFKSVCERYGNQYSYIDEIYEIISPKCMEDLFEEGRKLNHCVGGYADRIIGGKSCIMFIRKREAPDIPYFTMEIWSEEGCVRQIQGLSNRLVDKRREPMLYSFLKKWAKAKKLTISSL